MAALNAPLIPLRQAANARPLSPRPLWLRNPLSRPKNIVQRKQRGSPAAKRKNSRKDNCVQTANVRISELGIFALDRSSIALIRVFRLG